MRHALSHARVLTDTGWRDDLTLLVEGEHIAALLAPDAPQLADAEIHELDGLALVPGFIDTQVNGGGGVLLNDAPSVDGIRRIAEAHRRFGTSGLLPTLISDEDAVIRQAIDAVDAAIAAGVPGVLGIHIEGPFLAAARKGVHDEGRLRQPNAESLKLLTSLRRGVTIVTLAPERVSGQFIRQLNAAGVRVCIGHTAATYAQVRAALAAGASGFTHLFNAMSPLTSREPGAVGAALEDAKSWCGLIVDGHHLHPASVRVALAAKPRDKLLLVTDAMPPTGTDAKQFELQGRTIKVRDGRCETVDGVLAGSVLNMAQAVVNCVQQVGLEQAQAIRMASTCPADFLGLSNTHGRIRRGCRADLAVLDHDGQVHQTWIGGQCFPVP